MKNNRFLTFTLLIIVLLTTNWSVLKAYDITVAKDGSGNYSKVQDAFNAVPDNSSTTTTIFIKNGTYKEKLKLASSKMNVSLIGESRDNTILTYDDHASIAGGTNSSYSTWIEANDFYAENLTFQNTIDSRDGGSQAVALMVTGDRVIFYNCRITGFQDTYYLKSNTRSYTKNCIIEGTTDFIFGAGIALIEDCVINNRKDSHITAHSQNLIDGKPANKYGFVFKNCEILVHPQESVSNASLGRPWGNAARVVYLNCYEGSHIRPEGWSVWNDNDNHLTAYYAEYNCTGPGYLPSSRLSWTYQLTDSEASIYTKELIFKANTSTAINLSGDWNPIINSSSNNPPSITISSPASGSSYIEPANITINANASDSDGSVSQVEFFQGSTSLGTDNTAPYSVTWSNVAAGSYNLTAVATDNEGASTTSAGVNITVNVEGAISIIIQENETGFVSVDGTIDNNNAGFTGDGFANTDNASGKGINWEICIPENGTYSLVWRYANGSIDDRTAQVIVDGSEEVSNVSFPSTSAWTTWGNSSAVNVSLSAGTHQIRLEATIATGLANVDYISMAGNGPQAGACSTTDIPVTGVSVSPTSASVNVGATTQLSGTVSPSNATNKSVSWSSSNTSVATVSSSGLVTGMAKGSASITVTADDGGFTATCNVSVTDNTNPTYTLTTSVVGQGSVSPSSGTFDMNEQLTITASPASDWKFLNWSGDASGTSATITLTMDSDKSLTANFEFIGTGNCENPVTISLPFSQDGEGEYCWKTSDDISNINSWGLEILEINGVDLTNIWSNSMPPKQDGYYNIHYVGDFGWSHLEIASAKNSGDITDRSSIQDIYCYPNPVGDLLNIQFSKDLNETIDIYLLDATGKVVLSDKANGIGTTLDMSGLPKGLFLLKLSGTELNIEKHIIKQ